MKPKNEALEYLKRNVSEPKYQIYVNGHIDPISPVPIYGSKLAYARRNEILRMPTYRGCVIMVEMV